MGHGIPVCGYRGNEAIFTNSDIVLHFVKKPDQFLLGSGRFFRFQLGIAEIDCLSAADAGWEYNGRRSRLIKDGDDGTFLI